MIIIIIIIIIGDAQTSLEFGSTNGLLNLGQTCRFSNNQGQKRNEPAES